MRICESVRLRSLGFALSVFFQRRIGRQVWLDVPPLSSDAIGITGADDIDDAAEASMASWIQGRTVIRPSLMRTGPANRSNSRISIHMGCRILKNLLSILTWEEKEPIINTKALGS